MQRTSTSPKPRWPLVVVSALFVVVAAIGVYAFLWDRDREPEIIVREDPIADLLGWIPATDETRASFAVWTPDAAAVPAQIAVSDPSRSLALEPFPEPLRQSTMWSNTYVSSWASAGSAQHITVLNGQFDRINFDAQNFGVTAYRGATLYSARNESGGTDVFGVLGNRVILAESSDQIMAVVDAATGRAPSLADDEYIVSLLQTAAPSNALMVVDAAKHAAACAGGSASEVEPSGQYVAVAYGRIGEGGAPRTLVATSFATEDEAAAAEPAYDLGWQDGYVLAGNSGAPISNFAKVNFVSQSGNLLIAELVEGREDGWTRAAIRFATPVCEAVSESLPNTIIATPETDEPSALSRALESLPDPGMEGATLASDFDAASTAADATAPEDLNIRAEEIETWLATLGPIPSFDVFPTDGLKLARWPETLGISLGSISAISETHGSDEEQTIAVLVGTWDSDIVEENLGQLGFVRTNYGEATIYTFTGSLEDPSHALNRAADATWANVALLGDRIFVSPSSRRLREVLDIVTRDDPAPEPLDGVYLRDRFIEGKPGVTMVEIVGREFMNDVCVNLGVTGVAPEWYGASAQWTTTAGGGIGEVVLIPESGRPLADIQRDFAERDRSDGSAESLGFQRVEQSSLVDGTIVLIATFNPVGVASTSGFFSETVEGCQFGTP